MPENYNLDPNTSSDFSKKEGEGIPNIQSNIETPQSIPQPGIPQPIPQTEIPQPTPQSDESPFGQASIPQQPMPNQFGMEQPVNQVSPTDPFGQITPERPVAQEPEQRFAPPPSNVFIRTSESDLERIKTEGGNISGIEPTISEPSISPEMPNTGYQEILGSETVSTKKNKLIPLLIISVLVIGVIALGYIYLLPLFGKGEKLETPVITEEPSTTTTTIVYSPYTQISGPYQKTIIEIGVAGDVVKNAIREKAISELASADTFKVLVPKVHQEVLSSEEVILSLIPQLPERLHPFVLARKFLAYTYYGDPNASLGLIIDIGEENREEVKTIFLSWEKNLGILDDLKNLFLIEVPAKKVSKAFEETTNAGAEIRYFEYSGNDVAMSYAFFDQYLILSSSLGSINSAISHLSGATEPILP